MSVEEAGDQTLGSNPKVKPPSGGILLRVCGQIRLCVTPSPRTANHSWCSRTQSAELHICCCNAEHKRERLGPEDAHAVVKNGVSIGRG